MVAIPSLIIHAFLSRTAKGKIDGMEQAAISFTNVLAILQGKPAEEAADQESEEIAPTTLQLRKALRKPVRTDLDQPESPTWFPVAGSPSDLEYGWLGHDCHCVDRVGDVWFGASGLA